MIDWNSYDQSTQVQQVLVSELSHKPIEKLYAFAQREKMECSQPVDNLIYCSIVVSSHLALTKKKWLIEVQVMDGGTIGAIAGRAGNIGP